MAWEKYHVIVTADPERLMRVRGVVQWFESPGNGLAEVYTIYHGPALLVVEVSGVGRKHDAHRASHCICDAIRDRTLNDPEIEIRIRNQLT